MLAYIDLKRLIFFKYQNKYLLCWLLSSLLGLPWPPEKGGY